MEKRRNPRIDIQLEGTIQFHRTNDTIECVTRNISEGCVGIMIVTPDPRVCSKADVDLLIPMPAGKSTPVICTGRIVWYSEEKESFKGGTGYVAGIFVDSISRADRKRLEQAMERNES